MEAIHDSQSLDESDYGVSTFEKARSLMFAAAFRTLGNAAEAEDVVQDAWLRWQKVQRDAVRNAPAFLTTTTRRLAINRVLAARTRHETPLDAWHAEAIDPETEPGLTTERGQALESALLLVLGKLSPMERAAYLLREAFDYSYQHIARVVRASEANSRQLVTRARKHLVEGPRVPVPTTERRRIIVAFIDATRTGDLTSLEAVLSADIVDSLSSKSARSYRASCENSNPKVGAPRMRCANWHGDSSK
jgi:RNA polymerase sigma-70 factor (ECF subfamily)